MKIDFMIANVKNTPLAQGQMQIYFLRDYPKRSPHEFAKAFNMHFSGFMIEIKENASRGPRHGAGSQPTRLHDVLGVFTEPDGNIVN